MSPRRKRGGPRDDWRTAEQMAEDKGLSGTWYRCRRHGQTAAADTYVVGDRAYCTGDECSEPLLLVSHAMEPRMTKDDWNAAGLPHARRAPAAAEEDRVDGARKRGGRPSVVFTAILKALEQGPMTRAALAEVVYPGVDSTTRQNRLGAALVKLLRRGAIERSRDLAWLVGDTRGLAAAADPPAATEAPSPPPATSTCATPGLPPPEPTDADDDSPAIVDRESRDMDVAVIPLSLEDAAVRKAKADGITVPQALLGFALLGAVPRSRDGSAGDFDGEFSFRVSAAEVATWPAETINNFMHAFRMLVIAAAEARRAI